MVVLVRSTVDCPLRLTPIIVKYVRPKSRNISDLLFRETMYHYLIFCVSIQEVAEINVDNADVPDPDLLSNIRQGQITRSRSIIFQTTHHSPMFPLISLSLSIICNSYRHIRNRNPH